MDIRHLVTVDHANLRQLMDDIRRAVGAEGISGRDRLFDQLDTDLRRHMMLMETVIHPALQQDGSEHEIESHRSIEDGLDALTRGDKTGPEWTSRFEQLSDQTDRMFSAHVQMITTLPTNVDPQQLAHDYVRAKGKAIRSGRRFGALKSRPGTVAGLALGIAALGLAAAAWRSQSRNAGTLRQRTMERLRRRAV